MIPGEYFLSGDPVPCNEGRVTTALTVINTGDRPVQVGSHFHFFEVNRKMLFNRERAYGMRLNIPAGTAVRFEPGEEKTIELVSFGGAGNIFGFNNLVDGSTSSAGIKERAIRKIESSGFKNNKS